MTHVDEYRAGDDHSESFAPAAFVHHPVRGCDARPGSTVAIARYQLDPTGPVSFQVGPGPTLAKVLARGSFAVTPMAQPVDIQVAIVPDSGGVAHAIVPILVEIDELGPGSRPISVARRLCTLSVP